MFLWRWNEVMLSGCLLGFAGAYLVSAVLEFMWITGLRDEDLPTLEDSETSFSALDQNYWAQPSAPVLVPIPQHIHK
jgi:hypothetical protein